MTLNFKEAYKSANDNIHGDSQLIDKIFENAKKNKVFKINYYTLSGVAAAIVICCGLYASQFFVQPSYDGYNQTSVETARDSRMVSSDSENAETKNAAVVYDGTVAVEKKEKSVSNEEVIFMNKDEYFQYLGILPTDLEFPLPEGMSWTFPEEYTMLKKATSDEIYDDANVFVALDDAKPERIVSASVSKSGGETLTKLDENVNSVFSIQNGRAFVEETEYNICAYIEFGEVYVTLNSAGLTREEFDILLENIL